jgi:hypothetical protein
MQSSRYAALLSFALSAFGGFTIAACGGAGSGGLFQVAPADAGTSQGGFDGSPLTEDAAPLLEDAGPCPPASVASFEPAWKPPLASKSGACTKTQMSSFFDACLGASSTTSGCTAFVQSNTACTSCLQSDDTDPQYGPVVWHASRTYYTTNIAGCIADEQGDAGAGGCGAAYQAVVQCKETACSACLSAQDLDFSRFSVCESQAGTECGSFNDALQTACGTALTDPKNAVAVCIPPAGDTAEDAYLRLAPVFCGQ